jgi:nucleoside-diphosphate-sugar epimerase
LKAFVTGATGFLGSHLVERLLERGDDVRALVRPTSNTIWLQEKGVGLVHGDVTHPVLLREAVSGADIVYHTAAKVGDWGRWSEFQAATVAGTRNVLRAAAGAGVPRLLHVSTDGVYALSTLSKGVTEESPLEKRFGFLDYYRRAKSLAERAARRCAREGRLNVTIVRPALLLGERDRAMFPGIVAFLKSGSAAYLGDGRNRIPYVYAGDVADACILAATEDRAGGQVYNVVSDEMVTQRDLLETVAEAAGLKPPRRSVPVPLVYSLAFAMEAWCLLARRRRVRPEITRFGVILLGYDYQEDASKIRRELGWEPKTPLREAVRRCVEWSDRRASARAGG